MIIVVCVNFGETKHNGGYMFVMSISRSAKHMMATLVALIILSGLSVTAFADTHADLLQANAAFHQALREANVSTLGSLLDDRFTWTTRMAPYRRNPTCLNTFAQASCGSPSCGPIRRPSTNPARQRWSRATPHCDPPTRQSRLSFATRSALVKTGQHWKVVGLPDHTDHPRRWSGTTGPPRLSCRRQTAHPQRRRSRRLPLRRRRQSLSHG